MLNEIYKEESDEVGHLVLLHKPLVRRSPRIFEISSAVFEDIVKCSRCQQCFMHFMLNKWITCSVNPTAGRERQFPELWLQGSKLESRVEKFKKKAANLPQI